MAFSLGIFVGFAAFFVMEKTLRVLGGGEEDGHSHSHSHSHSPDHPIDTHSHTHTSSAPARAGLHSRHQSLEIKVEPPSHLHLHPAHARLQAENSLPISPITPNYKFGHDDHFETHHSSGHAPNLHDHSHVPDHHEGHSDNMRGVFLHVMAVIASLRL